MGELRIASLVDGMDIKPRKREASPDIGMGDLAGDDAPGTGRWRPVG
jgi:hypothetical protein